MRNKSMGNGTFADVDNIREVTVILLRLKEPYSSIHTQS